MGWPARSNSRTGGTAAALHIGEGASFQVHYTIISRVRSVIRSRGLDVIRTCAGRDALPRDPAWHVSTLLLFGSSDRPRPRNRSLTVAAKGRLQSKNRNRWNQPAPSRQPKGSRGRGRGRVRGRL